MSTARTYSTRRYAIVDAIVELLKGIDGSSQFMSDLNRNVYGKLKFFDEVTNFPAVCVTASTEVRQYQTGGYRDRLLEVRLMIFIKEDNPLKKCEAVLEDVETLIEENGRLAYIDRSGATQYTHDITVLSLSTDEGTLDPISIGEMALRVHY
jgi:hypothetical protein